MNRQTLKNGTLVCSAMLLYGWAQSAPSAADSTPCGKGTTDPSGGVPEQASRSAKYCIQTAAIAPIGFTPERLFNLQWGKRSDNQLPPTVETVYQKLLEEAQVDAGRAQFAQAIARVTGIPKNSRHYETAQQLQEEWSQELLQQATQACQQAKVKQAIALLNTIPATSQLHDRAIELRQRWHSQAQSLNRAMAATRARDWQRAIDAIHDLDGSPMYHSLLVQNLLQQAMTKLYEPDQNLLQIATMDLPTVRSPAESTITVSSSGIR